MNEGKKREGGKMGRECEGRERVEIRKEREGILIGQEYYCVFVAN